MFKIYIFNAKKSNIILFGRFFYKFSVKTYVGGSCFFFNISCFDPVRKMIIKQRPLKMMIDDLFIWIYFANDTFYNKYSSVLEI